MRARVLEAFASWLTLRPGCGLPGSQLEQHPLVSAALEGLQSPETFDEAVDALVELIYSAATKGSPDQDSMPLIHRVVPAVSRLSCHSRLSCCRHALLCYMGKLHFAGPLYHDCCLWLVHTMLATSCLAWGGRTSR